MNKLKSYIDDRLSEIKVSHDLYAKVLNTSSTPGKVKRNKVHLAFRKWAIIALAAILCFACTISVLAATIPQVVRLLYSIEPGIARLLYPVDKATEGNGIKVEVLSVYNDNHNLLAYISSRHHR